MSAALLEVHGIVKSYGAVQALRGLDLRVDAGRIFGIVGPNGAGKTTYFNLISGQIAATAGTVRLMGEDVTRTSVAERCRKGLGRAFQLTSLFPDLSVLENVRLVIQAHQRKGFGLFSMADSHVELTTRAMAVLDRVRLDTLKDQNVSELSHGNQRKLEVAMLIALDPMVYMFDEPTAGMSLDHAPDVLDLIAGIKADKTKTVLLVEHKMDVVRALAEENATPLKKGEPPRHDGADQRTPGGLRSAHQDIKQNKDTQQHVECLGFDIIEMMPVQRAAQAHDHRADGKGDDLGGANLDAEQGGDGGGAWRAHAGNERNESRRAPGNACGHRGSVRVSCIGRRGFHHWDRSAG